MRVFRVTFENLAPAAWGLIAGSFFAARGLLELWRAKGGRPMAWIAEADGAPVAMVPGVEYGFGPLVRFVSLPDGCYGGVFVDSERASEGPAWATAILDAIAGRHYAKSCVFDFYSTASAH